MADPPTHPRIFSVAPGAPFLETLARHTLDGSLTGTPPPGALDLADTSILLPSRRAARALGAAFLAASGAGAVLLPHIATLGDIDEEAESFADDAPSHIGTVSALARQLVLADIARDWAKARASRSVEAADPDPVPRSSTEAAAFAADLGRLFDAMEVEEVSRQGLDGVLPDDFSHLARNWEINLDFLSHALNRWEAHLAERGRVSAIAARTATADRLAERYRQAGSATPVIAAGSTGSVPATARLLAAIAGLENGAVVLPGLDCDLDEASWDRLTPDHPQFGLKQLLDTLGIDRAEVIPIGAQSESSSARARLASEMMRPSETADLWRARLDDFSGDAAVAAFGGLSLVEAASDFEEARAIALMLREVLERPGRTAALVTPDRRLARRVGSELARWDIAIDDSAGRPLSATAHGIFLRLIAECLTSGFAPAPLIGLLKHPLGRFGRSAASVRRAARAIELIVLRGARPAAGIDGLRSALAAATGRQRHPVLARLGDRDREAATALLEALDVATAELAALLNGDEVSPGAMVEGLTAAAESIAMSQAGETSELWRGEAGEALARFLADLADAAGTAGAVETAGLARWLEHLMASVTVRMRRSGNPRLSVWGPLEARLQHADLVILASLNEGTWPAIAETDPWLGRHMRAALGLAAPERRIGLQAHDFVEGFLAAQVVLTRSKKSDGTPTVSSRWIWRLKAIAAGLDCDAALAPEMPWLGLAGALDPTPMAAPRPGPRPTPPLAARPVRASVTGIETWIRDPYAVYARQVLDLQPLEPADLGPDARDYGDLIHGALAVLLTRHPVAPLPADALDQLLELGAEAFSVLDNQPGLKAYWWTRFCRIARWFIEADTAMRAPGTRSVTEIGGAMRLAVPGMAEPFTLTARADRIDVGVDGLAGIIDYKTGALPSQNELKAMMAPQLPLEALILHDSGFGGVTAAVGSLAHLQLTGREPPGRHDPFPGAADELVEDVRARIMSLLTIFAREETPFASRVRPKYEDIDGDYDHLARVREWSLLTGRRHE